MHIVEAAKELDKAKNKKDYSPDLGGLYTEKVEYAREIEVHTDENQFPELLFRHKSPYQTEQEFDYIRNNYRAITVPVMDEFFGVTNRIFNRSNFSISYQEPARPQDRDEPLEAYLEQDYPIYDDIVKYFQKSLKRDALVDPNGVIVVRPYKLPVRTDEEGNPVLREKEQDGKRQYLFYELDQTVKIKPVLKFFPAKKIIDHQDHYVTVLTEEKSVIERGGHQVEEGYVFEIYDSLNIWKVYQVGKKEEWEFETLKVYEHDLEEVPAYPAGQNPTFKSEGVFYESPIHAAVEPLNIVAVDNSTLDILKKKCGYPIKYAFEDPCDYDGCDGGFIWNGGDREQCPQCQGTGFKKSDSPLTVYRLRTPGSDGMNEDPSPPVPPVGYVSPNIDTLKFLREEIKDNIEIAKSQLRINISNDHVRGGDDTAKGKEIDREEMFSYLKGISDHFFSMMKWGINIIGRMRYQEGHVDPVISEPDEFAIRSSSDITEEIAQAKERDLPSIFQHNLLKEQLEKRFNNDEKQQEEFRTFIAVDRLANLNNEEIKVIQAQKRAAKWEIILHDSFFQMMEEAKAEREEERGEDGNTFMELTMSERKQILVQKAKAKAAEIDNESVVPEETKTNL